MKMKVLLVSLVMVALSHSVMAQTCSTKLQASTPTSRFMVNANGTVTDKQTGLMWKQCAEGLSGADCNTGTIATYTWQAALNHVADLNTTGGGFATYTDWRVPNIKELGSIIELRCSTPLFNLTVFPNVAATNNFWSSTVRWFNQIAYLGNSGLNIAPQSQTYSVRLVRGH